KKRIGIGKRKNSNKGKQFLYFMCHTLVWALSFQLKCSKLLGTFTFKTFLKYPFQKVSTSSLCVVWRGFLFLFPPDWFFYFQKKIFFNFLLFSCLTSCSHPCRSTGS